MFPQLAFDLGRVADEIKLVDLMIVAQRHHGASHEARRAEIAAHRIQGDLHWWETLRTKASDCKAKKMEAFLPSACCFTSAAGTAVASDYFPSSVNTCRPR